MLKLALYFILGISVVLFTNLPVLAKGKEVVVPPPHPEAIYWTLGILFLILCVCGAAFHVDYLRKDDDYH
jgi:hypothetical protein